LKLIKINEDDWAVEISQIEIKRDEYDARIVRLITTLIEIDQSLFPQDSSAQADDLDVAREAA
jgi:hypothetical protein